MITFIEQVGEELRQMRIEMALAGKYVFKVVNNLNDYQIKKGWSKDSKKGRFERRRCPNCGLSFVCLRKVKTQCCGNSCARKLRGKKVAVK